MLRSLLILLVFNTSLAFSQTVSTMLNSRVEGDCKSLIVEKKVLNGHQSIAMTEDPSQPFFAEAPAGVNHDHKECVVSVQLQVPAEHVLGVANSNLASTSIGRFNGIQYLYDNNSDFSYKVSWDLQDKYNIPYQGHSYAHVGPLFANYFGGDLIKQLPAQWTACKKQPQVVDLKIKIDLDVNSSEQNLAKLIHRNSHVRVWTRKCKIYGQLNPVKKDYALLKAGLLYRATHSKAIWTDHNDSDPGITLVQLSAQTESAVVERMSKKLVIVRGLGKEGYVRLANKKEQKEFDKYDPREGKPFEYKTRWAGHSVPEEQLKGAPRHLRMQFASEEESQSCLKDYTREQKKAIRKLLLGPLAGAGTAATGAALGVGYEVLSTALAAEAIRKGIFLASGALVGSAGLGAVVGAFPVGVYMAVKAFDLVKINRAKKFIEDSYRMDQKSQEKISRQFRRSLKNEKLPVFMLTAAQSENNEACFNSRLASPASSLRGDDPNQPNYQTQLSVSSTPGMDLGRAEVLPRMVQALDQLGDLCDGSLSMSKKKLGKLFKKGKGLGKKHLASRGDLKKFVKKAAKIQNESRKFQTLSNVSKASHDVAMNSIRNMKGFVDVEETGRGNVDVFVKKGYIIDLRETQMKSTPYSSSLNRGGEVRCTCNHL